MICLFVVLHCWQVKRGRPNDHASVSSLRHHKQLDEVAFMRSHLLTFFSVLTVVDKFHIILQYELRPTSKLFKAKFHYAIWFEAGSKPVADRFKAGRGPASSC